MLCGQFGGLIRCIRGADLGLIGLADFAKDNIGRPTLHCGVNGLDGAGQQSAGVVCGGAAGAQPGAETEQQGSAVQEGEGLAVLHNQNRRY